jgi:hypothetical protein
LKIYNQALKIYNQAMKIYFQALKIILFGVLACFFRGVKLFSLAGQHVFVGREGGINKKKQHSLLNAESLCALT